MFPNRDGQAVIWTVPGRVGSRGQQHYSRYAARERTFGYERGDRVIREGWR